MNSANATHGVVPNISVDGMLSAVMGGGGVLGGGGSCALTARDVRQEEVCIYPKPETQNPKPGICAKSGRGRSFHTLNPKP